MPEEFTRNKNLPRCSLPGAVRYYESSDDILNLHNCALGRWCETADDELVKSSEFQEMQRIHVQLHWIAQEIVWSDDVPGSSIGVGAMEHFNELWRQLQQKMQQLETRATRRKKRSSQKKRPRKIA